MQANTPKLQTFRSYSPDVERRRHVCSNSPGLIRLKQVVANKIIAHDRDFWEPRSGYHNAQLINHVEEVELISERAGMMLGLSESDLFVVGQIGFFHDLSKTHWHAYRINGKLPPEEQANRETHDHLSWEMLVDIARGLDLADYEWDTLNVIGTGVKFHHHPECLADLSTQIKLLRELKLTTIVHFSDIYVAVREWRGDSHPGESHRNACEIILRKFEDPKYKYLREDAMYSILDALCSEKIDKAYSEAARSGPPLRSA